MSCVPPHSAIRLLEGCWVPTLDRDCSGSEDQQSRWSALVGRMLAGWSHNCLCGCPSCQLPGLLIHKQSSRRTSFFLILRRQWWTWVWRMVFLPVCVKGSLTETDSASFLHPSTRSPSLPPEATLSTICTALWMPYLGALNKGLWGLTPSPAQSACPSIRVHQSHLQATVT